MATSPETRTQAIEIMKQGFCANGVDDDTAGRMAEKFIDQAIQARDGDGSDSEGTDDGD